MSEPTLSDKVRRSQVVEALRQQNLQATAGGEALHNVSPGFRVDAIEVSEDELLLENDRFSGAIVWHVTLSFDGDDGDPIVASETFPGRFEGHFIAEGPIFDEITVELSALDPDAPVA